MPIKDVGQPILNTSYIYCKCRQQTEVLDAKADKSPLQGALGGRPPLGGPNHPAHSQRPRCKGTPVSHSPASSPLKMDPAYWICLDACNLFKVPRPLVQSPAVAPPLPGPFRCTRWCSNQPSCRGHSCGASKEAQAAMRQCNQVFVHNPRLLGLAAAPIMRCWTARKPHNQTVGCWPDGAPCSVPSGVRAGPGRCHQPSSRPATGL